MRKNHNINIKTLSFQMMLAAMVLSGIGLSLPRLSAEYGFELWQQGLLVSAQYMGFTVAVLLGGIFADKYGQIKIVLIAIFGAMITMSLFGSIISFSMALIAVTCVGVFGSILENGVTSLAINLENKNKDINNVIVQIAFSLGAMLVPLIFLFSVYVLDTWRLTYYFVSLLALVLFFIMIRKKRTGMTHDVSWKEVFGQYLSFVKKPKFLLAPIAMFLYVGAEIGLWAFAPVFFEESGFGILSGIISTVLIWFLMLLGRILTAYLVKRYKIVSIMIVFGLVSIASLVMLLFASASLSIILIGIAGFTCAPFFPLIMSWMTDITGKQTSSMIAVTMAAGTLGPVVLSSITGIVAQTMGARFIMLMPTIAFALLVLILVFFRNIACTKQHVVKEKDEIII